jgi:hypothetical protein
MLEPNEGLNISNSVSEGAKSASQTISQGAQSISEGAKSVYDSLANTTNSLKESVSNSLNEFSSPSAVSPEANQSFLNSNSMIAKFVFLVLILIAFMFLIKFGISLIGYFLQPSPAPYIVKGLNQGNNAVYVSADPKDPDSAVVLRSNNQPLGLEFTWSSWLLYTNANSSSNPTYNHIFNKGTNDYDAITGLAGTGNGIGVYFKNAIQSKSPGLHIVMDDVTNTQNTMDISGIPVGKWFHVAIRMENKIMDVYINGMIAGRYIFQNVPRQNYYGVYVCQNNGFSGSLSNLQYFDYALNVSQINNIVLGGPNLTPSKLSSKNTSTNYSFYLSNLWYNNKLSV